MEIHNIGFVSNVPLDYMHLVCIGVMGKMLDMWVSGNFRHRLSNTCITTISDSLRGIRTCIPVDFCRRPRSLRYLSSWKATEYRQFLLYTGPFVLKHLVSTDIYTSLCSHQNFMLTKFTSAFGLQRITVQIFYSRF